MTTFITRPVLTLKALFTVAAVATAVVAMPSGPDFALGVSPAYAKKISKVKKAALKALCDRNGGVFIDWGKGEYSCDVKKTWVHCYRDGCWGQTSKRKATGPKKTGKAMWIGRTRATTRR